MMSNADHSDRTDPRVLDSNASDVKKEVEHAIEIVRRELQKKDGWRPKQLWPVRRKVFMTIYDRLLLH